MRNTKRVTRRLLFLTVLLVPAWPSGAQTVTAADRAQIEREVRQTVDAYIAAAQANDLPKILSFWGDFDDFIHAGDGRVFGDRKTWTAWIAENLPDEWLYWNNSDIHVAVLAPNAAVYTTNFEFAWINAGKKQEVTGSWTYVFRRTQAGWQVVHSNGTHRGLDYSERTNP